MLRQRRPGGLPYPRRPFLQPPPGQGAAVLEAVACASTSAGATLDVSRGGGTLGNIPRRAPWQVFAGSEAQGGGAAGAQPPGVGPGGLVATRHAVLVSAALAAIAVDQTAATAGLSTGIPLGSAAAAQTVASAALATGVALVSGAAAQSAATATLSTSVLLSALGASQSTASATLGTGFLLGAAGYGQAAASAALTSSILLGAAAGANAAATAALGTGVQLAGAGYGRASTTAALSSGIPLAAQAAGIFTAGAVLTTGEALAAAAYGCATAQASFATPIALAALAYGSANVDALLATGAGIALGASVYGVGVAGADITVAGAGSALAANAFGVASAAADLSHAALAVFPFEPRRFDVKAPGEAVLLSFDFAPDLLSTESLNGIPSVAFRTSLGKDLNPLGLANGAAWIDGSQVVVPVRGGLDGREYDVEVVIATIDPLKVLTLIGTLPVRTKS